MTNSYINDIVKVKDTSIVTLEQAKDQLNVEQDFLNDDEHILFLIESARSAAEDYTGIDISLTDNTLEFIRPNFSKIQIYEAPFVAITTITATTDDVDTVITSAEYEIQTRKTDFLIYFDETIIADKLVIEFQTGYAVDEAPYNVQNAILVKVNDLYDLERTSQTSGTNYKDNKTFERLLNGHVISRW